MVMRMAAEILDLQLPTQEVKTSVLTWVLQPGQTSSEPLLPFNKALTDILSETWAKSYMRHRVNGQISRRQCPTPRDPDFLTQHPTPESLVVLASVSKINRNALPCAPPDRVKKDRHLWTPNLFVHQPFLAFAERYMSSGSLHPCFMGPRGQDSSGCP